MDYLTIDDLRIQSTHGCNEYERVNEQEFIVSLRVGCDMTFSGKSDAIKDTIDFNFLSNAAKKVFASKCYYLLEALAHDIVEEIFMDGRVKDVTISIRKPEVWPDGTPGISLTRSRS